jgi:hypothetical protein
VTDSIDSRDDEFVAAAAQALGSSDGADALDALGWWHLLADLGDDDSRAAVFALFRAQGRCLGSSTALGGLMAQPYLDATGRGPGSVVATIARDSVRRGPVAVVVGDVRGMQLLVDRPGSGAVVVDADDLDLRPVELPGRMLLHELSLNVLTQPALISEADAIRMRARSTFLGRIAVGLEILGAAEAAVALAVEHAQTREQFGAPIATFQAVRHLLAWARTDCAALESVALAAVALDAAAPARYDEILKALAGRNGRRTCERTLQVLGGIGFTAEHTHHHFHSRVLALDAMLGTSADLAHGLATWVRTSGADLRIPATVLLPTPHGHPA